MASLISQSIFNQFSLNFKALFPSHPCTLMRRLPDNLTFNVILRWKGTSCYFYLIFFNEIFRVWCWFYAIFLKLNLQGILLVKLYKNWLLFTWEVTAIEWHIAPTSAEWCANAATLAHHLADVWRVFPVFLQLVVLLWCSVLIPVVRYRLSVSVLSYDSLDQDLSDI